MHVCEINLTAGVSSQGVRGGSEKGSTCRRQQPVRPSETVSFVHRKSRFGISDRMASPQKPSLPLLTFWPFFEGEKKVSPSEESVETQRTFFFESERRSLLQTGACVTAEVQSSLQLHDNCVPSDAFLHLFACSFLPFIPSSIVRRFPPSCCPLLWSSLVRSACPAPGIFGCCERAEEHTDCCQISYKLLLTMLEKSERKGILASHGMLSWI